MQKRIVSLIFGLIGIGVGMAVMPPFWLAIGFNNTWLTSPLINAIIGAIIFLILGEMASGWILKQLKRAETFLTKQSPSYLLFGSISTIIGLVLAAILSLPLYSLPIPGLNVILPIVLMLIFGYLGFRVGTTRREEWRKLLTIRRRNSEEDGNAEKVLERRADENYRKYKILDTSVIIDGRVQAIAKTGFIEGTLLVPNFVLHELQLISDSADSVKRSRGRRGLDILNAMQEDPDINIEMYDGDFEDLTEVDGKLIKLAKLLDGVVVTNDFNLNKVSQFQNVPVFNINELANALKPEMLPGEGMRVTVIKSGTERQQGVAYLEDGTMVVVEDGQYYMNKPLDVVVTSALQTAAGRMIFAKPAHQQKSLKGKD
ncbi:PIN/TRAM domain-containing protein [Lacticaseibacillus saniviri]|uniref:Integral membrane protein n=1 Tax=Lacticaseibacillus saniviri JCM 17471 = DSM 24301 TaxID=1293598 RepID=A0A0R2MX32_9LACO|nr:PIN/TRAM domain-containing protein [Lacticaseibacillus saniviri]KRO18054.1 integral membrane protein [Lacticaseibacillus saniviri JCM 17471 = DSM 24301]MCG4282310.1 PIN/TRAM domain-containing protein [Lacticaseibacillus saniviri]